MISTHGYCNLRPQEAIPPEQVGETRSGFENNVTDTTNAGPIPIFRYLRSTGGGGPSFRPKDISERLTGTYSKTVKTSTASGR